VRLCDARGWHLWLDLIRDFRFYLIAGPCAHACLRLGEEVLGSLPGCGITLESRDFTPCCLVIDALIHIVFDQLTLRVCFPYTHDLSSPSTLRISPTSYFFWLDDTTHLTMDLIPAAHAIVHSRGVSPHDLLVPCITRMPCRDREMMSG
jgi:hypothetical protein